MHEPDDNAEGRGRLGNQRGDGCLIDHVNATGEGFGGEMGDLASARASSTSAATSGTPWSAGLALTALPIPPHLAATVAPASEPRSAITSPRREVPTLAPLPKREETNFGRRYCLPLPNSRCPHLKPPAHTPRRLSGRSAQPESDLLRFDTVGYRSVGCGCRRHSSPYLSSYRPPPSGTAGA